MNNTKTLVEKKTKILTFFSKLQLITTKLDKQASYICKIINNKKLHKKELKRLNEEKDFLIKKLNFIEKILVLSENKLNKLDFNKILQRIQNG
jgi:hypothetical protein